MFKSVNPKQSFPELEQEVLKYWEENKTFEKSVEARRDKKKYVFFDGPPFANGLPHTDISWPTRSKTRSPGIGR